MPHHSYESGTVLSLSLVVWQQSSSMLTIVECMQAELHGMLPVTDQVFEPLQSSALRWSNQLRQAAAVCNGLTMINKSTIAGDRMERSLFKTVEARFLVRHCQENDTLWHRTSVISSENDARTISVTICDAKFAELYILHQQFMCKFLRMQTSVIA